ncbi:sensor histidine kinase [Arthrobacter burdickii]|uniref:histidine kinase n=1 Tax=Arthrobacter burdickii TaxID=3035920 RepID=A0ABT8K082_9MICC|nr:PAS domain-containing sensor histidine kinase [Arthrobacter burdickii]MDN4610759.1 ATP-binding protein [Arthrobacter burdickii]
MASRFTINRSVVLCQIPLTVIVVVIGVTAPVLRPGLMSNSTFDLGFSMILLLLALSVVVPWRELPRGSLLVVPILDFVAIALLRAGATETQPALGVLAVFPVLWLMRSSLPTWAALVLTWTGSLLVTAWPLLFSFDPSRMRSYLGILLLPIVMLCIAVTIRVMSLSARARDLEIERKDRELTDLLRAAMDRERVLTAILDTVDVGLTAVDAHGNTTLTNRQQELFNRLATGHDTHRSLYFGADRTTPLPLEKRPIYRALTGQTYADELIWVGEGDAQRALSTAARPIKNADGRIAGALIVCSDVTELVEAVTAKDAFISNISHEFHAPLTSVLGYLELVMEDEHPLPAHLKGYVDVAGRNAERVLHLVADLLSTAGDKVRVHPRPVDLAALIEMCVRSNRLRAQRNKVKLQSDAQDPLWTLIDPLRISQVLDNLVSNAIKYSPGGGVVSIHAEETETCINLHVEDRGMGMTEQEARQVFSRFYRTPAARHADIEGAGLGLAITKSIVESHGGAISCVSSPGKGSRFTVSLPVNGDVSRVPQDSMEESV